jgi:hypothetical protein
MEIRVRSTCERDKERIANTARSRIGIEYKEKLTNILRFYVSMNEVTLGMEVIQTEEYLPRYYFDKSPRYPLLLVSLYKRQQILPQRFKYDADMGSLGSLM